MWDIIGSDSLVHRSHGETDAAGFRNGSERFEARPRHGCYVGLATKNASCGERESLDGLLSPRPQPEKAGLLFGNREGECDFKSEGEVPVLRRVR